MKLYKNCLPIIIALFTGFFSLSAFAFDSVAKQETTPPPAEGALTADQIPPFTTPKDSTVMPINQPTQMSPITMPATTPTALPTPPAASSTSISPPPTTTTPPATTPTMPEPLQH